jgi:protein-S-isoprenylcysteine O-methyltransferase Ste14
LSLLPADVELAVFYTVFGVWLLFAFVIESMIIGKGGRKERRTLEDRGSALLIYLSIVAAIVVAFQLGGANVTPLPEWTFFVGIFLMLFGIVVREWAVVTLKGFFLFRVGVLEDHRVVESGPYRLVRHPGYTGAIVTMTGIGLAVQSLAALLVLLLLSGIAYGYRIMVEERALLKDLGEPYSEYMRRTKRLIPFLL